MRAIDVPTRLVLCARDSRRAVDEVTARLARLAPQVEIAPVDLHHGLLLIEPAFLRAQVTATEALPTP